jgi:hypothetical protein
MHDHRGVSHGADVRVNSTTNGTQIYPAVAALKGGGFVVTWTSQTVGSVAGNEVYAHRYDGQILAPNGTLAGGELPLIQRVGDDLSPAVTALKNGGFVVTASSHADLGLDIVAGAFSATGVLWSGTGTEEVFFRLINATGVITTDDAYVVLAGSQLSVSPTIGLLSNDETPPATFVNIDSFSSPRFVASGADGTFAYAPGTFKGIDDVQYSIQLPDGTSTTAHVQIYVVPVNVGTSSTTLNLVGLTAS